MAWRLDGTYFESCSCDAVCPCTWSALTAKATLDRCRALLAYHVESGEIDGLDVSGLSFALFLDTPPVMSEGNWRVGVYLDDAASDRQAEHVGRGWRQMHDKHCSRIDAGDHRCAVTREGGELPCQDVASAEPSRTFGGKQDVSSADRDPYGRAGRAMR